MGCLVVRMICTLIFICTQSMCVCVCVCACVFSWDLYRKCLHVCLRGQETGVFNHLCSLFNNYKQASRYYARTHFEGCQSQAYTVKRSKLTPLLL